MSERTPDEDHEQLADELEHGADKLDERSEELEDDIEHARHEAEIRRREDRAAGASSPDEEPEAAPQAPQDEES